MSLTALAAMVGAGLGAAEVVLAGNAHRTELDAVEAPGVATLYATMTWHIVSRALYIIADPAAAGGQAQHFPDAGLTRSGGQCAPPW